MHSLPPMFLGLGANIDYEIKWDTEKFCKIINYDQFTNKSISIIISKILTCMKYGHGAEFAVPDEHYLNYICSSFSYQETLGGTAARASLVVSLFDQNSYLHLADSPENYHHLLPDTVNCIWNNKSELPSFPHVIIQYPSGVEIRHKHGEFITPNSNRIILTADIANEMLPISDELPEIIKKCPISLISGFNSIQDKSLLSLRLSTLESSMLNKSDNSIVIYEDAAFHNEELHKFVIDSVANYADVLSFNEDELSTLLNSNVDIHNIYQIHYAIEQIDSKFPNNTVILHNSIWNDMSTPSSSKLFNALQFAVATSTTRYMFGDSINKDTILKTYQNIILDKTNELSIPLNSLTNWSFIPTPQVDCPNPTTIGLGDSFIGGFLAALNDPSLTTTQRS